MNLLDKIVKLKIKNDNTEHFTDKELNQYASILQIDIKTLHKVLEAKNSPRIKEMIYSKKFKEAKEEYLIRNKKLLLEKVVHYNIKLDSSYHFNLDKINNLSKYIEINPYDFTKYILNVNRYPALLKGVCKQITSNTYKEVKEEYLDQIRDNIIEYFITNRINNNYTRNFSYAEVKLLSIKYKINVQDLLYYILKISIYKTKDYKESSFYASEYYNKKKIEYIKNKKTDILNNILTERISYSSSIGFNKEDIKKYSQKYNINNADFIMHILDKKYITYQNFNKDLIDNIKSQDYLKLKEEYLNKNRDYIINEIIIKRMKNNHTQMFTQKEINDLCLKYQINIRDFLYYILKIDIYEKRNYDNKKFYSSDYYNTEKEKRLQQVKYIILNNILKDRIANTSSIAFNKEEILHYSTSYGINICDFIMLILGKSYDTYYDFKMGKTEIINSLEYLEIKKEHILNEKEKYKYLFNENTKTYYTTNDLKDISIKTNINFDDIVLYFFGKTKGNLYGLKNNDNRKSISYGSYKYKEIPEKYFETNYEKILSIVKRAIKSAFNYLGIKQYNFNYFEEDIIQEVLINIMNDGNMLIDDKYLFEEKDLEFKEEYIGLLHTKCFYHSLTIINKFIKKNPYTRNLSDIVEYQTNLNQDFINQEKIDNIIDELTDDEISKNILNYFANHLYSNESISDLEAILNISKEEILKYLKIIKQEIENTKNKSEIKFKK